MAKVADYIIMRDTSADIGPNFQSDAAGERTFTVDLPDDIVLTSFQQSPVLMFVVRTPGGSVNVEVDVNGQRITDLAGLNAPIVQTIHDVIDRTLLRAGIKNDFVFRVVSAQENAKLRLADVILWFQREPGAIFE